MPFRGLCSRPGPPGGAPPTPALRPLSDIDLLLLHSGTDRIGEIAERLWYPIWDEGLKLGHAVRTIREALQWAASDLDTATSPLSIRPLAGHEALTRAPAEQSAALRPHFSVTMNGRESEVAMSPNHFFSPAHWLAKKV